MGKVTSVFDLVADGIKAGREKLKAYHGSPHDMPAVDMVVHKETGKSYYIETDRFGSYKNHPVIKKNPDQYEFVDHFPQGHFDSSKIGTGEGAQAYGRGLYFAEREGTAINYRDQLTPRDMEYEDWLMSNYKEAEAAQDYGRMDMYERAMQHDIPQDFRDIANDTDYDEDYRALANEIADEIDNYTKADGTKPNFGHMYEVDIDASPDELLDYDLPLKDQSPHVQKAIDDLMVLDGAESYSPDGVKVYLNTGVTGDTLGHEILQHFTGKNGREGASKTLNFAGIKGIKYADAQTRFSSEGKTHNYVVFDDKLLNIARKYGVTLPVASAILAGTMTPEQAQASLVGMGSKFGRASADMLGMAEKMEDAGVSPREIWQKTGWERNQADGQWRTEHTNFDNTKVNIRKEGTYDLAEVIDDPALLSAYDDKDLMPMFDLYDESVQGARDAAPLTKLKVQFDPDQTAGTGSLEGRTIVVGTDPSLIHAGKPEDHIRDTVLHELQHGIQEREGWARGGNQREFDHEQYLYNEKYKEKSDYVDKRIAELESIPVMERSVKDATTLRDLKPIRGQMRRYLSESLNNTSEPYDMYYNLTGEVEARNVSQRDAIGERHGRERLRKRPPESTEQIMDYSGVDVRPRDSQIVRYSADDPVNEYMKDAVIEEQSFGDMVSEYGQINRNLKALEQQKFDRLMAEDEKLRSMGSASFGKVSPELAAYRRSRLLPSLGNMAVGAVDESLNTLDFLSNLPRAVATMQWNPTSPLQDTYGEAVRSVVFGDERDKGALDEERFVGGFLGL